MRTPVVQQHFIICVFVYGTLKWVCFLFDRMLYLATRVTECQRTWQLLSLRKSGSEPGLRRSALEVKTMSEIRGYNHRIIISWMDSYTAFLIHLTSVVRECYLYRGFEVNTITLPRYSSAIIFCFHDIF